MSPRHISRSEKDRWQITRERFQLADAKPPPPYHVSMPEEIVPQILKRIGLEKTLWEKTLLDEWEALTGSQVAAHTRPGPLDRGVLLVYVKNSVWMTELRQFGEKALLEKLQERFGRDKFKGIRLQLDPNK